MDLSNLSSNLPTTHPITEDSITELNKELTSNFKDAAKSVAALYRLANTKNLLTRQRGYLDCIDDILEVLSKGEDVENWALLKKAELSNNNNNNNNNNNGDYNRRERAVEKGGEVSKKEDVESTGMGSGRLPGIVSTQAPFKFHPSMVPLSLNHSNIKHYKRKQPHGHTHQRTFNNALSVPKSNKEEMGYGSSADETTSEELNDEQEQEQEQEIDESSAIESDDITNMNDTHSTSRDNNENNNPNSKRRILAADRHVEKKMRIIE
ncbi:hypothetical protein PACTADRAFT_48932 [Pachysolen tannophilus NRRL Y-2460]|uniref:Uncharacterized protein n=1 Tax=Pachysolen tannophilus NRRL Y-2460 TaxID=669874 RepID=A0A1E4TZL8_PACTA|nr:hypothetical protein PACTADRAFT_48932 [Pachysolen tannophilus NRRL Y-2460]